MRLDEIFNSELQIMEDEKRIESATWGPFYLGITKIDEKGMSLAFIAGCDERYTGRSRRKFYKELKLIFEKYDISFYEESYINVNNK